jgi:hypothetical protein
MSILSILLIPRPGCYTRIPPWRATSSTRLLHEYEADGLWDAVVPIDKTVMPVLNQTLLAASRLRATTMTSMTARVAVRGDSIGGDVDGNV